MVRRAVTTGARDAGLIEIKSGLRAGERVAAAANPQVPAAAGPDQDSAAPPAAAAPERSER
jgi:hypothetical protein